MFQSNLNKLNPSKKKGNKLKEGNFHFFLAGYLNHKAAHIQNSATLPVLFVEQQQGGLEQFAVVSCLAVSTFIAFESSYQGSGVLISRSWLNYLYTFCCSVTFICAYYLMLLFLLGSLTIMHVLM